MVNYIKNKLLIISKAQFGYLTDYFKYCEYSKDIFDITYICFDYGFKKLEMEGIRIVYLSRQGPKVIRGLFFILYTLFVIMNHNGLVFISFFERCSILKRLNPKKKMILDIRTLSISNEKSIRVKYDSEIRKACNIFDYVTVISESLSKKLLLEKEKYSVISLGADVISHTKKEFSSLNLLYVGTLYNREIEKTIEGLALFKKSNPSIKSKYNIIGFGGKYEVNKVITSIENNSLESSVFYHSRIPYGESKPYYDMSNLGVSFVPITEYYDYQPVTKTYEYVLSGMACIATNTYENRLVINQYNGLLCKDTPLEFAEALDKIFKIFSKFDSDVIRNTLKDKTWKNIVENSLIPLLNRLFLDISH